MMIIRNIIYTILIICSSVSAYGIEQDSQGKAVVDFHRGVVQIRDAILSKDSNFFEKAHSDKETRDWIVGQIISLKQTLLPHLTRPFEQARFDESGSLILEENERFFYDLMKRLNFFVSCRGEPNDHAYYTDKYSGPPTFYHSGPHYNFFGPLYKKINCAGAPYQIHNSDGIYDVRNFLNKFELQTMTEAPPTVPILIMPSSKDGHAFLTLHILDLENQRVLTSVLINSVEDGDYTKYIMGRFNILNTNFGYTQTLDQKQWVQKHFPNTTHFVSENLFFCNWSIPILDCSYHIQTASDDRNCSFYTYVTTLVLTNMFKNTYLLRDTLTRAQQIFQDPQNQALQSNMSSFLKRRLVAGLSQLFNTSGERRADSEIKQYFMKLRWDLTTEWLKLFMSKDLYGM